MVQMETQEMRSFDVDVKNRISKSTMISAWPFFFFFLDNMNIKALVISCYYALSTRHRKFIHEIILEA